MRFGEHGENDLNKARMVELLEIAHPDAKVSFERLLESEFFALFPGILLPLASVSTLGFRIFDERSTDAELIIKYENLYGNRTLQDAIQYRGRGIFHNNFVGKDNYRVCGEVIGVDLVNNAELASSNWDVMVRVADWQLENVIVSSNIYGGPNIALALGLKGVTCFKTIRRGDVQSSTLLSYWIRKWLQKTE